jgi:hypothetical protein
MTTPARARYTGYRFPAESIGHALWLYFRFPLGLRMVEELLAARGIIVSHETVRQWARKFGQKYASEIRRRLPRAGDKWHLDEVVLKICGVKHWLWRALDQSGIVLDVGSGAPRPRFSGSPIRSRGAYRGGPVKTISASRAHCCGSLLNDFSLSYINVG